MGEPRQHREIIFDMTRSDGAREDRIPGLGASYVDAVGLAVGEHVAQRAPMGGDGGERGGIPGEAVLGGARDEIDRGAFDRRGEAEPMPGKVGEIDTVGLAYRNRLQGPEQEPPHLREEGEIEGGGQSWITADMLRLAAEQPEEVQEGLFIATDNDVVSYLDLIEG